MASFQCHRRSVWYPVDYFNQKRISGPLLDRIDIHLEVPRIPHEQLSDRRPGEISAAIQERVARAREIQATRFAGTTLLTNADMGPKELRQHATLDESTETLLGAAVRQMGLSAHVLSLGRDQTRGNCDPSLTDCGAQTIRSINVSRISIDARRVFSPDPSIQSVSWTSSTQTTGDAVLAKSLRHAVHCSQYCSPASRPPWIAVRPLDRFGCLSGKDGQLRTRADHSSPDL
jgi:hypothetical protein